MLRNVDTPRSPSLSLRAPGENTKERSVKLSPPDASERFHVLHVSLLLVKRCSRRGQKPPEPDYILLTCF